MTTPKILRDYFETPYISDKLIADIKDVNNEFYEILCKLEKTTMVRAIFDAINMLGAKELFVNGEELYPECQFYPFVNTDFNFISAVVIGGFPNPSYVDAWNGTMHGYSSHNALQDKSHVPMSILPFHKAVMEEFKNEKLDGVALDTSLDPFLDQGVLMLNEVLVAQTGYAKKFVDESTILIESILTEMVAAGYIDAKTPIIFTSASARLKFAKCLPQRCQMITCALDVKDVNRSIALDLINSNITYSPRTLIHV